MSPRIRAVAVALAVATLAPGASAAEDAWVLGAPLNLRAGAGLDNPVLGSVAPGERLEVIGGSGEWARVRRADGTIAWIASRYLAREMPPEARVGELEAELERLRQQLESSDARAQELLQRADTDARAGAELEAQLQRAQRENEVLRAGARWPERIVGALILSTGMALGALLRGVSGRRRQTRLKL